MPERPWTPFDDLNARERAVALAFAGGIERGVTASSLGMRPGDVDAQRNNVMIKLGVSNLSELVRLAVGYGVISTLPAPRAKPPDSSTADGRALILERMRAAAAAFASVAGNTGCPVFMAVAAKVAEFAQQCHDAEGARVNWLGASVQGGVDGNDFTLRVRLPGAARVP